MDDLAEEWMIAAMRWSDPERDVLQVRKIAVSTLDSRDLRCIWTASVTLQRIRLRHDQQVPEWDGCS